MEKQIVTNEPLIKSVVIPCGFSEICGSPSKSEKWACSGFRTDEERLLMCAFFNRFENPEQKPEYMSGRDWIKVLQRKVRANESVGEKLRDKTRNQHR